MNNFKNGLKAKMLPVGLLVAVLLSCHKTKELSPQELVTQWQESQAAIPDTYIVKFKAGYLPNGRIISGSYETQVDDIENFAGAFLKNNGVDDSEIMQTYVGNYIGFSATMQKYQAEKLRQDANIEFVVQDKVFTLANMDVTIAATTSTNTQSTSWGVTRVGGALDATGKVVYIVDTGVSMGHPDLNVKIDLCKSFVANEKTAEDGNGHGTHVAGIIAAKSNSIGVIGVAANATIVAVKVLSKSGVGTDSGVVAGLNYVGTIAKPGEVVNLSLGTSISIALDAAVRALAQKGIRVVMAAGNSANAATNNSPGRCDGTNLYTVSAIDKNDKMASFSSYGNPPIDYAEPGVSILSCYKNGTYATLSGTSMAAPHLAGLLVVTNGAIKNGGSVSADKDSSPDIIGKR